LKSLLGISLEKVGVRLEESFKTTCAQAARRPAIRLQAWAESIDPFRADRIFALDERLTHQFEKTLAMLIRMRELRMVGSAVN